MGDSLAVQTNIRHQDVFGNPGAVLIGARFSAGSHDGLKRLVDREFPEPTLLNPAKSLLK
jgi:hypothetical protein